ELSWIAWDEIGDDHVDLLEFTREMLTLRNNHIVFRRSRFFHGRTIPGTKVLDVTWLGTDGGAMRKEDWGDPNRRTLGMMLSGQAGERFLTERGQPEPDDSFLVLLNAGSRRVTWTLPETEENRPWRVRVSTAFPTGIPSTRRSVTSRIVVGGRTALVLVQYRTKAAKDAFRP
ncbi:MAG: hypothetical protein ACOC7V_11160, partial [Spirochaetota bacterium]